MRWQREGPDGGVGAEQQRQTDLKNKRAYSPSPSDIASLPGKGFPEDPDQRGRRYATFSAPGDIP
jgi:hypothetical protein